MKASNSFGSKTLRRPTLVWTNLEMKSQCGVSVETLTLKTETAAEEMECKMTLNGP